MIKMAKRRYVSDSFWSDSWVEDLDPLEKYLFLYLLTNQQVSISWIYEIKLKRIAFETWIDKEMVEKMLNRFQKKWKIYYIDWIIVIVNFVKNQNVNKTTDKLWIWIEREIKELWAEKLDRIGENKDLVRTLYGAYKDLDIPYFTLLNFTLLNLTKPNLTLSEKEAPKVAPKDNTKVKTKVKKYFNVLFNLYKKWDEWKSKRNYLELLKKMSAEEIEIKTRIYKFNSKDVEYKYTKNLENILDFDFINSIRIDENILLTIWEEATMMWRVIKNAWDLLFPDIKYDKQLYKEKIEELDKKFNLNILEKLTEWNRNWIEKILVR